MDGTGVAGIAIHNYCGSFPHSRSEAPASKLGIPKNIDGLYWKTMDTPMNMDDFRAKLVSEN